MAQKTYLQFADAPFDPDKPILQANPVTAALNRTNLRNIAGFRMLNFLLQWNGGVGSLVDVEGDQGGVTWQMASSSSNTLRVSYAGAGEQLNNVASAAFVTSNDMADGLKTNVRILSTRFEVRTYDASGNTTDSDGEILLTLLYKWV